MASNKKVGVNPKVAKEVYNKLGTQLDNLANHLNSLNTDVVELNKNAWYGGKKATTWYTNMDKRYQNIYKYCNGVNQFRSSLKTVFQRATTNNIEF